MGCHGQKISVGIVEIALLRTTSLPLSCEPWNLSKAYATLAYTKGSGNAKRTLGLPSASRAFYAPKGRSGNKGKEWKEEENAAPQSVADELLDNAPWNAIHTYYAQRPSPLVFYLPPRTQYGWPNDAKSSIGDLFTKSNDGGWEERKMNAQPWWPSESVIPDYGTMAEKRTHGTGSSTQGGSVTERAQRSQAEEYAAYTERYGKPRPDQLRYYTHSPPYPHPLAMYPNIDSEKMEHIIAQRNRVPEFVYEPPISTTIHLMDKSGYILYVDEDRVTLAETIM